MQNIELKARYEEFDFARQCIQQLGGRFRRILTQKDIYFDCERGRLKLRLNSDEDAGELIFYQRDDHPGPRESQYQIYLAPEPARLEAMLRAAYNVRTIVEKTRELYTIDNVRVHLDTVVGLGSFIEFEAVMTPERDYQEEQQKLEKYLHVFQIEPSQLVPLSYCDLMERKKAAHEAKGV